MKLKPYPKYKDSGIKWIGKIPEGWEAERYKIRFKYVKGKIPENLEETNEEGYLPYLSMEYLRGNGKGILCANDPKSIKVSEGDLLLLWDGSNAGEFVLGKKGYLSSTMVKLNVENFNSNFSWYLCKSFEPLLRDLTIGMGIPHVNGDTLGNIGIPVPNSEDQTAIANFLDKKTAKIDVLIEKDKKLIALLKEKRTAMINHAVTKGLDPNVKLKDSGIQWIGEIPEGWDVIKIKHIAGNCSIPVQTGPFGAQLHADDYVNEGIPFILIRNVNHGKINNTNIPFVSEEDAERLFMYRLKADDIVFSRVGSLGRAALVTNREEGWLISGQMLRLRLKDKRINRNYLVYLFQSKVSEEYVSYESVGSTRESLNTEILSNFISPLPPLPDQTAIANYLDQTTSKIDKTIKIIEKKIKLLEEYKKSLVHYVVTGKVDVRGVEA